MSCRDRQEGLGDQRRGGVRGQSVQRAVGLTGAVVTLYPDAARVADDITHLDTDVRLSAR